MAGRFPFGLLSLDDPMAQRKPLMGLLSQDQGMQRQPLPGNGMSIDTIMPGPGGSMSAFAPQNASAGSLLNMIPDAPAPDAVNAGPAPMPAQPQQQPGAPMQLHSQDAAPPQWSQQNDAVQSGMVGSEAEPHGGILGGFGKALGALSNVYGGGGPGDGLINLGIAVGSPGNLLQNVARANEMTARSNQQQQKTQALNQTARLASEKLGISYEQALGALQSGGGNTLLSQIFKAPEKPQLVTVRNADGSESQKWLRPGETGGVQVGAARPAETVSDVTDPAARAAAGIPADYRGPVQRDATGKLLMPGRPSAEVNIAAGEKEWDKESAKLFAKRYDGITSAAMNAQEMLGMYDMAEKALSSGVRTGFGAEAELDLRRMAQALGVGDADKIAGGELIRSVQNRMALLMRSPDGGMGMPGALSDRDIMFLKSAQIGIDRSPEGNRQMLEAFRKMEQRKIDIARLADNYIAEKGRLDVGFNKAVREYANANPLFPDQPATTTPSTAAPRQQPSAPSQIFDRPSWRRAQ